ncbi:MAG: glycosyltransferase [Verrucomicrobia bacterium]|nr:glycosyltransferase [Verrucomicrobiota bacterium]
MRLLRSIRSVNPAGGGPIEGIKQVARVHAALGHETEIVSLDSPEDAWVKECPVKVHAMGPVRSGYGYSSKLVPWLREHRREYDAVVVSGLWQYSGFGVWRALRGTDTPYFVFPHGMLDPWFKRAYPLKHLKKWLYWPWADYRMLRDARAVLFTSEEECRAARESFWLYRCNEVVVNYGIAAPTGDAEAQQQAVLARFPELAGRRAFVFLSRIHEKKGCDLLVRAFAKIARTDDSLRLVFAGPDQTGWSAALREIAQQLGIADRIVWTGMISGDLKWGMLHLAEAFVLPSHQENFGIAVAEALACGTPVLISNKVNIWREIESDRAGLVDEDDGPGTLRLLEKWLALSAQEKDAMRKTARETFQARFEVTRAAEALIGAIA